MNELMVNDRLMLGFRFPVGAPLSLHPAIHWAQSSLLLLLLFIYYLCL